MISRRNVFASLIIASAMFAGAPALTAELVPAGTVSIDETQFGFLVGGSTGGGKLDFKGKTYPFKIGGLSVGDIGVSKVKAVGEVYNMTNISQFPGTYSKIDASATVLKGGGGLRLKNEHGVIMRMDTKSGGLQLSAGAGGVKITMK